ncbi:centrosomal protein of 164 kDa-like isoform X2 [Narcine bancroftii]|uniref:centrosomal protein of 164 kDa-like isoform X2 n=1 Tax=Narcine bancroftii TaxID=1343680 RepID=UPI003831329D
MTNHKISEANITEIISKKITEEREVNSFIQNNATSLKYVTSKDRQGLCDILEQYKDFKSEKKVLLDTIDVDKPCIDQDLNHLAKESDTLSFSHASLKQIHATVCGKRLQSSSSKKCEELSYSEDQRFYQEILKNVKANREIKVFSENVEQVVTKRQILNVLKKQIEGAGDRFDSSIYNDEFQPILLTTSHCEDEIIRIDHGVAGSMDELLEAVDCSGSAQVAFQKPQFCHQPGQVAQTSAEREEESNKNTNQEASNNANWNLGTEEQHREGNGKPDETALNIPPTLVMAPQGSLAPLRGLGDFSPSALCSSLGNTCPTARGLMKSSLGSSPTFGILKTGGFTKNLLGAKLEEKISLNLADLSEDEDLSREKSAPDTAQLMKNLHIDVGSLGIGFEYEESAEIDEAADHDHVDERTEPELQNLPVSDEEAECQKEGHRGSEFGSVLNVESCDVQPPTPDKLTSDKQPDHIENNIDSNEEKQEVKDKLGSSTEDGTPMRLLQLGHLERAAALNEAESEEIGAGDSRCDSVDGTSKLSRVGDVDSKSEDKHEGNSKVTCAADQPIVLKAEINKAIGPNEKDKRKRTLSSDNSELHISPQKDSEPSQELEDLQASEDLDEIDNNFEEEDTKKLSFEERRKRAELSERCIHQEEQKDQGLLQSQKIKETHSKFSLELNEEENRILKMKEEQLCKLGQQKEDQGEKLRLLKEQLRIQPEEEETRLMEELSSVLLKLREQVKTEILTTEEEIRVEKEAKLRQLRAELKSLLTTEQQNLEAEKQACLEQMRGEMDKIFKEEKILLEEKKEEALGVLRKKLKKETEEELEQIKNKHSVDLQRLKKTAEEKHQEALSNLQKQITDAHDQERAHVQEELHKAQRKIQQIADYELEISDLMKRKREGVEEDHERILEQMKDEHKQIMDRIREEYEEKEREQRSKLLKQLQEEHERLTKFHEQEISELRQELERRLNELRTLYGNKELRVQMSEEQLEMRNKELKAKWNLLQNQEMSLKLKRQQLSVEEDELQRDQAKISLSQSSKQELEQAKHEHSSLQDSIRLSLKNLDKLQGQQVELQTEVDKLRNESQRLQNRISELEVTIKKKQNSLNEECIINGASGGTEGDELHVEDLRAYKMEYPNLSSFSFPRTEDEQVSMDNVRYYISAEGLSINKAKEFLVKQTRSLRKRQAALRSAKQQWRHDVKKAQEQVQDSENSQILQDIWKNMDQEARHLDEMKLTMKKGQELLWKKEEKLNQLESSFAEELSDEDSPKVTEGKKVVTFDLTDSDVSSFVSIDHPQQKTELMADWPLNQHANIQYLSNSIQKITHDLNSVLSILGSMGMQQSPVFSTSQAFNIRTPGCSMPLSVCTSQSSGSLFSPNTVPLPSQWAWNRGTSSTLHYPTAQSLDDALSERWRKYFPGRSTLSRKPTTTKSRLGYVSASDQVKMLHQSHSKMTPKNGISIQEVIEANKKWLESFRKDPKISLVAAANTSPLMDSVIQLRLNENNQIQVYQL